MKECFYLEKHAYLVLIFLSDLIFELVAIDCESTTYRSDGSGESKGLIISSLSTSKAEPQFEFIR